MEIKYKSEYARVSDLLKQTSKEIVSDVSKWKDFLYTASNVYKYAFSDQLLIYAQNPNATACAEIDIWNKKMHCWVNKGAKAITLLEEKDNKIKLHYVFDVSDVHKGGKGARLPYRWKVRSEYKEDIISHLEKTYGSSTEQQNVSFEERMVKLSKTIAETFAFDIGNEIRKEAEGSVLSMLDDDNLILAIRDTIYSSMNLMILNRCDADIMQIENQLNLESLNKFNTDKTLKLIGSYIQELSKPILIEIGKIVLSKEKENQKIVEIEKNTSYNALKRRSESLGVELSDATERSSDYGIDIQTGRGLSSSESRITGTAGGRNEGVWGTPSQISEGTQISLLAGADFRGDSIPSYLRAPGTSGEEIRSDYGADGEERGRERRIESDGSNGMGSPDEQHLTSSERNNFKRNDLRLEENSEQLSLFPSEIEQKGTVAAAEASIEYEKPAAFSLSEKDIADILRTGGGRDNNRSRIYAQYLYNKTSEERAEFLKEEYGNTGKGFDLNGHMVSVWFDETGMLAGYGTSAHKNIVARLSWNEIEDNIKNLIEKGQYMPSNEAFLVMSKERARIASNINYFFRDGMNYIPDSYKDIKHSFPESERRLASLLSTEEGRTQLSDEIIEAKQKLESGEVELRFNFVKSPEYLLQQINDLAEAESIRTIYPIYDDIVLKNIEFITQDEIDYRLTRGSSFSQGNFRIYDFFIKNVDKKERITFLKKEYGTGGSSHALPGSDDGWEDHDAKGIKLRKGDLSSPYAEVLLNWNVVEKRISQLIKQDKYLSAEDKIAYEIYIEEKEQAKLKKAQEDLQESLAEINEVSQITDTVEASQDLNRYKVIETTDEHDAPYAIYDNQNEKLYAIHDVVQTFGDRKLAEEVTKGLNESFKIKNIIDSYNGEPVVKVIWSECDDLEEGQILSFYEANKLFKKLDTKYLDEIGYRKTNFQILYNHEDEFTYYEGRQDLGDGSGDIISHIKGTWQQILEDKDSYLSINNEELLDSAKEVLNDFVPYLIMHTGISKIEIGAKEALNNDVILEDEREYQKSLLEYVSTLNDGADIPVIPKRDIESYKKHVTDEIVSEAFSYGISAEQYAKSDYDPPVRKYSIYQIGECSPYQNLCFANLKCWTEENLKPTIEGYEKVYEGELSEGETLDDIYTIFNTNHPEDYRGRSLSVSDVVVIECEGESKSYFVDSIGFKEVLGFIKEIEIEKTKEVSNDILDTPDKKAIEIVSQNYVIKPINDVETKGFSAKEKYHQNIAAIKTLQNIENEGRMATPDEQEILAKYVGWGGLADAFDENKSAWSNEYQELKNLLSTEEYASARSSTLNAHYTNSDIIQSMYEALANMGFKTGNILEPSVGIGNFFGLLPESMNESKLYGVELDSLTGRIAKQLYPNSDVKVMGFEETDYPNDFFDIAIGNVPFGQYKVNDKAYDNHNFLIHDYFFAKSLDKVRPGGVVAFITSKGTLDKKNPEVRRYLAQRADLLGAIRLPKNAFKANAGTETTTDIIFLKKRDRAAVKDPDWVYLSENEDGIVMNSYFVDNPKMILGKMEMVSGPYGMEATCSPFEDITLREQLKTAIKNIEGKIDEITFDIEENTEEVEYLPADPNVKNYSYTLVDGNIYYRENSLMKRENVSELTEERIKGMLQIRDCTRAFLDYQLEEYSDEDIKAKQDELDRIYDSFVKKYGYINSPSNKKAFRKDSSYFLISSLEKFDDERNFIGKADMFSKRTIKKSVAVTKVDTAIEALAISLSERAKVDLDFMAKLVGKDTSYITGELNEVIFLNPISEKWETADEYLSGNVREKLKIAREFAEKDPQYTINVSSLENVQPKELDASEIDIRLGATWIDADYIVDFMAETFNTPRFMLERSIDVLYSPVTGQWNIKGKNVDYGNALTNVTYGTKRANAYKILEDSLNLKDVRIYDTIVEDGKEKRIINKKETTLACQKQDMIKEAFKEWIFKEPIRRQTICKKYNELFNSVRPREYDGSHLTFPGMSPDITLKPHQLNAVAHQLYGDNTLLAHCVGAGKTFEMIAAAMENKRLGLCQKSLFVVPNHLTEQWAGDFLRLYPGANILAATKKDFEPANRKKFCSRIATGEYDAIIIGHSQFEKIPLSIERQIEMIERQVRDVELAIVDAKAAKGEQYSIKQLEKTKKSLTTRLKQLNDSTKKDNVVTFEQLGIDRLFVDESHNYKNLFLYTKMRNVSGIAQTEAQKSSDMFAKCQYLDEITGGKGITFATGTPISNSMTELYTNMRYLQYGTLQKMGLGNFDAWASTFGETQTTVELAPEGTGYRAKQRFAKFFNVPELMSIFKECADVQTADMLNLPVPEAEYENVVLKPSDYQKDMVSSFADRAESVRSGSVEPHIDNMLKITNDGRKVALDQRLMNPMLPDNPNSKVNACVDKAFEIWENTMENKSTQLIFCDLSTPKGDGTFNVYDDIKSKLIAKGVPEEEIAFIHDANTDIRKSALFAKVRAGNVRFLLGSTQKMGAGTNVQDKLIALHHLDVPWRPSDIEQQEGRILRQGNTNEKVKIFRYVTEGTFDSYSWQVIENKQKFISQIMTSKSPVRSCDDIDEAALTYAEVKALATGNPHIKEKMDLDIQVSKLKLLKANHTSQIYRLEDDITQAYPKKIASLSESIEGYRKDIILYQNNKSTDPSNFSMQIGSKTFIEKKEAASSLMDMLQHLKKAGIKELIGNYLGFEMQVFYNAFDSKFYLSLVGSATHTCELGADPLGNIQRINNMLDGMESKKASLEQNLENVKKQLEIAKIEVVKPFAQEQELKDKSSRLVELNALLNMDEKAEVTEKETKMFNIDEISEEETELALQIGNRYMSISEHSEGYEYTIYDEQFRELDGGVYDDDEISLVSAVEILVNDLKYPTYRTELEGNITPDNEIYTVDYNHLMEQVEKTEAEKFIVRDFKLETEKFFNPISNNSAEDIENTIWCYIRATMDDECPEVKYIDGAIIGSRARGLEHQGSDLDFVFEYEGDISEDTLFNVLNEEPLFISGIRVDINPITKSKSGDLSEYLKNTADYLDKKIEKLKKQELFESTKDIRESTIETFRNRLNKQKEDSLMIRR